MPAPITSLAERLGRRAKDKLLIINSDDSGMSHSVNRAFLSAWEKGIIRSTTAMVPCPWFPAFAAAAKERGIPVGVHLTTTSEWSLYRWGPVSPKASVPSLLDEHGYFYPDEQIFYGAATEEDVAREFRAQIERFCAHGLEPTHLDSHMGTYHFKDEFFEIAYSLAKEFGCTLRVGFPPRKDRLHKEGYPCVDRLYFDTYDVPDAERVGFYESFLRNLDVGVTELVVHCGTDDAELDAITDGLQKRRAIDAAFFSADSTKRLIEELGIVLIGYKDLQRLVP